ncbi:hypothetical protein ARMGADRAFT_1081364 [Armillaria gallica]|uniref:Uncharacterized protein n=1 Tax=Armillaria gallica TaxID=47427 RepID=A0A2H3DM71_ARMGA|nr:hypothetical protein ARMGADRAFT_1081364 [Armillaria gallica]
MDHSDIDALKDVFNSAGQTILEIKGACEEFADNVDIDHATVVTDALSTLNSQLRKATALIPNHVMTDTDGKWACDAYAGDVTSTTEFVGAINSRKDDFQAVHFTSHICRILKRLATDGRAFHKKFKTAVWAQCRGIRHATGMSRNTVFERHIETASFQTFGAIINAFTETSICVFAVIEEAKSDGSRIVTATWAFPRIVVNSALSLAAIHDQLL